LALCQSTGFMPRPSPRGSPTALPAGPHAAATHALGLGHALPCADVKATDPKGHMPPAVALERKNTSGGRTPQKGRSKGVIRHCGYKAKPFGVLAEGPSLKTGLPAAAFAKTGLPAAAFAKAGRGDWISAARPSAQQDGRPAQDRPPQRFALRCRVSAVVCPGAPGTTISRRGTRGRCPAPSCRRPVRAGVLARRRRHPGPSCRRPTRCPGPSSRRRDWRPGPSCPRGR